MTIRALAMAVISVAPVTALAAQEVDRERLERLKTVAPALLGRAYLINENTLQVIGMARQGATVHLSGEDSLLIVTAATADSVAAEFERRRATYAAAIRARGFVTVAGEYELTTRCPAAPGIGPILVPVTQDGFQVSFAGTPVGIVVERTLVTGQGDGSDDAYRSGPVGDGKIATRQFSGRGCETMLTRYRRPDVRLEHPEDLLGTWEGLWDGQFGVRFTITPSDSGYAVHYEWQEYAGGPFEAEDWAFHPVSRRSIRGGPFEISIERDGEYGARAVGRFARTRTARLKRVAGRGPS